MMEKKLKLVPVIWLKGYPGHVSYPGLKSAVDANLAPKLFKNGYIQILPDEKDEEINTLPSDFPVRDKLFSLGFDTIEKVIEAGDSLLDEGVSPASLKKIKEYKK